MTYNVWFEKVSKERFDEILKMIVHSAADFVCLQEITETSKKFILQSDYIRKYYKVSANELGKHGYGAIMLTRYSCTLHQI